MIQKAFLPLAGRPVAALAASLAAAFTLGLGGCAVGPDYQPATPAQALPQHFPTGAATAASASVASDWWRSFDDAGLDVLVAAALKNSPDLAAAEANIRQARAALAQTESARSPQVNAQGRAGRDQFSRNGENFANIPLPNPKTTFNDERIELDASWEIDLFGHTARAIEAANARAQGMQAQRADVELRVSAETARNVLDFRYLSLRIARAQASVADNEELLRLVRLQRDAGLASDTDVQQAGIGLSNARAALPPLQSSARGCIAALLPLTALTDDQITSLLGTRERPPELPAARTFAVSSTLLQRRPDVRAAERALAAATAEVGEATADRYPRFTLVGDGGWDSIHPGELWQRASHFWNIGPQVYLPLLNGGRVEAAIRATQAGRDTALANYRKSVLAALADVESAMLRCQGDDGRLAETRSALELQRRQVDLARLRADVGESPRLDMLSSHLQQIALEDQQLAIRQSLSEDLVLVYKALGGGLIAVD